MKNKSVLMTLMLVGSVLAVYAFVAPPNWEQSRQNVSQSNKWEYARLVVIGEDELSFLRGGDQPDRIRSTRGLLGDLGGNGKPSLANVLNQIGTKGWELVTIENSTWTFQRRR